MLFTDINYTIVLILFSVSKRVISYEEEEKHQTNNETVLCSKITIRLLETNV